jgi:small subunit ribosomal protein S9
MDTTKTKDQIITIGRRKNAVARVYMRPGTGNFLVNDSTLEDYFPRLTLRTIIMQPLLLTKNEKRFDFVVTLVGGGKAGQAGALRHGIARALLKNDVKTRPILKENSLFTRDPRMKERKKYGRAGARRRFQFSKR